MTPLLYTTGGLAAILAVVGWLYVDSLKENGKLDLANTQLEIKVTALNNTVIEEKKRSEVVEKLRDDAVNSRNNIIDVIAMSYENQIDKLMRKNNNEHISCFDDSIPNEYVDGLLNLVDKNNNQRMRDVYMPDSTIDPRNIIKDSKSSEVRDNGVGVSPRSLSIYAQNSARALDICNTNLDSIKDLVSKYKAEWERWEINK